MVSRQAGIQVGLDLPDSGKGNTGEKDKRGEDRPSLPSGAMHGRLIQEEIDSPLGQRPLSNASQDVLERVHTCLPGRLLENVCLLHLLIGKMADFVWGKTGLLGHFVEIGDISCNVPYLPGVLSSESV
jgi:hypothetical protein